MIVLASLRQYASCETCQISFSLTMEHLGSHSDYCKGELIYLNFFERATFDFPQVRRRSYLNSLGKEVVV